jgi:hypothetical protein
MDPFRVNFNFLGTNLFFGLAVWPESCREMVTLVIYDGFRRFKFLAGG